MNTSQVLTWNSFIRQEKQKDYFKLLVSAVQADAKCYKIFPPHTEVFNAFRLCPLSELKVLILGMDPYHGENQAHGLAFSVLPSVQIPPSLRNIFKEIQSDLQYNSEDFKNGYLLPWANQGVMLLNTALTVREGQAGSHAKFGWETFTDNAIKIINDLDKPIVIMLWGAFAKNKKCLLTNFKHLVLEAGHPSPLSSRLFFGCKHFSQANEFLIKNNLTPIDWRVK